MGVSINEQLAKELYKSVTKKFKRRKIYSRFKDNIWAADLAKMESLSWENKNIKGKTILNAFIEIVNESNRKPNKLWVDQGR